MSKEMELACHVHMTYKHSFTKLFCVNNKCINYLFRLAELSTVRRKISNQYESYDDHLSVTIICQQASPIRGDWQSIRNLASHCFCCLSGLGIQSMHSSQFCFPPTDPTFQVSFGKHLPDNPCTCPPHNQNWMYNLILPALESKGWSS